MYEVFRKYTAKEINPPEYFGPEYRPVLGDKENSLAVIQSVAQLFEGSRQKLEFLAKNHLADQATVILDAVEERWTKSWVTNLIPSLPNWTRF
jgi:hypothetical protein